MIFIYLYFQIFIAALYIFNRILESKLNVLITSKNLKVIDQEFSKTYSFVKIKISNNDYSNFFHLNKKIKNKIV